MGLQRYKGEYLPHCQHHNSLWGTAVNWGSTVGGMLSHGTRSRIVLMSVISRPRQLLLATRADTTKRGVAVSEACREDIEAFFDTVTR